MNWNILSNKDILNEIGIRLRSYRINQKLTQKELAEQSGVSLFPIVQMERGKSVSISNMLPVLRTLRLLDNLDLFLPEIPMSPIKLANLKGKMPKRIRKKDK